MRTVGYILKKKIEKPTIKEIKDMLTKHGIEFDEKAKREELLKLLPQD